MSASSPVARYARAPMVLALALVVAGASTLIAGCGRDGDRISQASAADAAPMLPGVRGVHVEGRVDVPAHAFSADATRSAGAQRFDSADGSPDEGASGALLPPVMHTAD